MNVPMDYEDGVEQKATHLALLDIKKDDNIEVLPWNRNILKANLSPVRMSVLESGLKESIWDWTQVPRGKEF